MIDSTQISPFLIETPSGSPYVNMQYIDDTTSKRATGDTTSWYAPSYSSPNDHLSESVGNTYAPGVPSDNAVEYLYDKYFEVKQFEELYDLDSETMWKQWNEGQLQIRGTDVTEWLISYMAVRDKITRQ